MTKVTPFAFARRQENTIIRNGIDNNYDEEILKPFTIKKLDNDDTLLGREFPTNRKTEFCQTRLTTWCIRGLHPLSRPLRCC